jgi:GntR family transcriptional repressor for pyruvate dehydrogenase complex
MDKAKASLLDYLAEATEKHQSLPSIPEIGRQLGISTSSLREQLEVARQLGVVEIRPKTGMSLHQFSLTPTLMLGFRYSQKVDPLTFEQLSDLRKNLESAYWPEAAPLLNREEIARLESLVQQANQKIARFPIQIPKEEHRDFHLGIFQHLNNHFVFSILESYWNLYQSSDLIIYMDQAYLELVWNYHQKIVDALKARDFARGHEALLNHMDLVKQIKKPELKQRFE